jgi:hypothetical protein
VLIWLASFPRSGSTFLRIVLNRRYGISSSVIYDFDGVADRVGGDLIGYTDRPGPLAEMRASDELHFIKTHRPRDADVDPSDRVICLVRDGRDALVSWARQLTEAEPARFTDVLRQRIEAADGVGTGSWGANVLSWVPSSTLLSYGELVADPAVAADRVLGVVAPQLVPDRDATIPGFDDLRQVDPAFFRRGTAGSHRDEMPADLHELFWSRPGNREAMVYASGSQAMS